MSSVLHSFLQYRLERLQDEICPKHVAGCIRVQEIIERVFRIAGDAFEEKRDEGQAVFLGKTAKYLFEGLNIGAAIISGQRHTRKNDFRAGFLKCGDHRSEERRVGEEGGE